MDVTTAQGELSGVCAIIAKRRWNLPRDVQQQQHGGNSMHAKASSTVVGSASKHLRLWRDNWAKIHADSLSSSAAAPIDDSRQPSSAAQIWAPQR